jgi:hypothetical protein
VTVERAQVDRVDATPGHDLAPGSASYSNWPFYFITKGFEDELKMNNDVAD